MGSALAITLIVVQQLAAEAQTTQRDPGAGNARTMIELLAKMRPGQWLEVLDTRMARVVWNCTKRPCPNNGPVASELHGNTGPSAIMSTWSGGTLETRTPSLVVWGGGHSDYGGNEVYAFNLNTMQWSILSVPSSLSGYAGNGILFDGSPAARHTYDGMAYLPEADQIFVTGGSHWSNGFADSTSWFFDPRAGSWRQAPSNSRSAGYGDIAVYDPVTRSIFVANNQSRGLLRYKWSANSWSSHGVASLVDYHMTAAIDPVDRLLVAVGNGHIQSYSIDEATLGASEIPDASGALKAQNANAPGFVWDTAARLFVAWSGGSTLYTLDPHTWRWTARPAAHVNGAEPPVAQPNGTFGRFQYDVKHNCFVLANAIDQNVYIYSPDF